MIEATDADGNVIATLTATKAFGCVLVSGAGVSDGDTITVSVDGAATTATASTTGTSGIATGGMGGGPATGNRPEGSRRPCLRRAVYLVLVSLHSCVPARLRRFRRAAFPLRFVASVEVFPKAFYGERR